MINQNELNQLKKNSKVKIYNMFTKRIKTVTISEIIEIGKSWRTLGCLRIWDGDIEEIVNI